MSKWKYAVGITHKLRFVFNGLLTHTETDTFSDSNKVLFTLGYPDTDPVTQLN